MITVATTNVIRSAAWSAALQEVQDTPLFQCKLAVGALPTPRNKQVTNPNYPTDMLNELIAQPFLATYTIRSKIRVQFRTRLNVRIQEVRSVFQLMR